MWCISPNSCCEAAIDAAMPKAPYTIHIRMPLRNSKLRFAVHRVVILARSSRRGAQYSQIGTIASDDSTNTVHNVVACSVRKRSTAWIARSFTEAAAGQRAVRRPSLLSPADAPGDDAGHGSSTEQRENVRFGHRKRDSRQ